MTNMTIRIPIEIIIEIKLIKAITKMDTITRIASIVMPLKLFAQEENGVHIVSSV